MRALRRALGLVMLVAIAAAAAVVVRRRVARTRERVDLYFEDGSMASHEKGSPEAERLLPLAREVLYASRLV